MAELDTKMMPTLVAQHKWELGKLTMGYAVSRYAGMQKFEVGNDGEAVQLHIGLRGDYKFFHKQLKRGFDLVGGHLNMMYSKGFGMVLENKSEEIETFGIKMAPADFLDWASGLEGNMARFAELVTAGKPALAANTWPGLDLPLEITIRQILSHPFHGKLEELFLEAKAMELLALAADACLHADVKLARHIKSDRDRAAINSARELIQSRLESPLSLAELAKALGINSFKLKHGFKEVFRETILAYTTRLRLESALQLLRDTEMQVAEVAFQLGFATPGHFGQIFKKHFGCTPNSIRNKP
jgi:AraC-like DNA-binding protein